MNKQNRSQFAPAINEFFAVSRSRRDARRKRCAQCGKPFGLMRRNHAGMQFCSRPCVEKYTENIRVAVEAKSRDA